MSRVSSSRRGSTIEQEGSVTRTRIVVPISLGLAVSVAWLPGSAAGNGQHDHEHPAIPAAYANAHIPTRFAIDTAARAITSIDKVGD